MPTLSKRRFGAGLTALVGVMNVVSALYPAFTHRFEILGDFLPLHVIRMSQTATVLAGICLIILADGLRKRRERALHLTITLLLVSSILNIAKGLDFEEALISACVAPTLWHSRSNFYIQSSPLSPRQTLERAGSFALLYLGYLLAGFSILRRAVRPVPGIASALSEPVHILTGTSALAYLTPQAQWFQRSIIFVGAAAIVMVMVVLLRPLAPKRAATQQDTASVRTLVSQFGSDSLSYFALQDERSYFFHTSGRAALTYRLQNSVAIVAGEPVGPRHLWIDLIQSFIEFAENHGFTACFLGISGPARPLFLSLGLRTVKIGEEAVLDLGCFSVSQLKRKVRRAVRHVEDADIRIQIFEAGAVPAGVQQQLQSIWHQWVRDNGGEEKGFSMTLRRLPRQDDFGCRVVAAMQGQVVKGYICVVPAYGGNGWSLDAMRRGSDAPNGLMEFLIVRSADQFREEGYTKFSLNFATLSNSTADVDSRLVEQGLRLLYRHLSSVYQLHSLYQFNNKFQPDWQSRYLAFRDVRAMPKVAMAIVQTEDPVHVSLPPFLRLRG